MYYESIGPHRFKFHTLGGFCGFYFYRTETQSVRYKMLRVKYIDKFQLNLFIVLPIVFIGHVILFTAPIYAIFCQHVRTTPLAFHLPFFEKNSDTEFIVNIILQMIMAFYAMVGALAVEMASCMINHAVTITPELIQYHLDGFFDEFQDNGINLKSISLFRNCIIQIQDFNR